MQLELQAVDASYRERVLIDADVRPSKAGDGSYAVVAQVIGGTQHASIFTFSVARWHGFSGRDWIVVENENEEYPSRKAAIIGEVEARLCQSGLERRIRHLDGKD